MEDQAQVPATNADNTIQQPAASAQTTAPPASWRDTLPDDLKANATLGKFTEVNALAGAYVNLERMLGFEKVPRPKGDFDPGNADWKMFLKAAGQPDTPDDYKFEAAKLPDGMAYDTGLEDKFKPAAHALGLNAKQAQGLRDFLVAHNVEAYQAAMTERENDANARREALQKELGSSFDSWVKASEVAQSEFVSDALLQKIDASGLTRDPEWIRTFGKIGKAIVGEEKLKTAGAADMTTPDDYKRKAMEFQATNAHALYTHGHPDRDRLHAEWTRLMQLAYPE